MLPPILTSAQSQIVPLLRKAGLTLSQIPKAWHIMRETVEQWLHQKMEDENVQQVAQLMKGQLQEKGPQLVLETLKDLLVSKLVLRLGIRSVMASGVVTLLLPFVLQRIFKKASKHPKVQAWWKEQEWRNKIPTTEDVRNHWQKLQSQKTKDVDLEEPDIEETGHFISNNFVFGLFS